MRAPVTILPSPLLPIDAYEGLAAAFALHGQRCVIAPPELAPEEGPHDLIRRWAGGLEADSIMVAHSNAGYLAPTVRALSVDPPPIIFMDAALAPPTGHTLLAPREFRTVLAALADDQGRLPPWTRWWTPEQLAHTIPAEKFDEIDRRCPRLSLSYFDTRVVVPERWIESSNAYLAFGETYADELAQASGLGWPCQKMDGGHLQFLYAPDAVAVEVLRLAADLGRI